MDFRKIENIVGYGGDDYSIKRPFEEPPIVVNYFFHEEIIPSAKKKKERGISMSLHARRSANERE